MDYIDEKCSPSEYESHKMFIVPAIIEKAINELHGLVKGINLDGEISAAEIEELLHWCSLYAEFKDRAPFCELFPIIASALEDRILSPEEISDIIWMCDSLKPTSCKYTLISAKMQEFIGLIHGLLADSELTDKEIFALDDWISDNSELKTCYPFDEIEALLTTVLSDRKSTRLNSSH